MRFRVQFGVHNDLGMLGKFCDGFYIDISLKELVLSNSSPKAAA